MRWWRVVHVQRAGATPMLSQHFGPAYNRFLGATEHQSCFSPLAVEARPAQPKTTAASISDASSSCMNTCPKATPQNVRHRVRHPPP